MEPLTVIALATKMASATGLGDWVKNKLGSSIGEGAAQKIIDVAKIATGAATPEHALEMIERDAKAATAVKQQLLEQEHELVLAQLKDVQSARGMYSGKNTMADDIAKRVISQNHVCVCLLIMCNGLVLVFVKDTVIAVALGNLFGASIGALWQKRQQVINFFFGSSLGSKLKTAISATGK